MSTALFDLSGRTALVTGSSRGLGRAIAEGMAKAGAKLIINGVDPKRVEQAVTEFRAAGHQAEGAAFNVTDEPAIVAAFENFDKTGLAVDILVNNAGIQHRKPLVEFTTDEWRKVIETNLTSAFVIGREAAKRGIKNLTRSMAVEWAQHGIQANAIGPGYMLTDMNEALVNNTDFNNWLMGRVPSKRWGKPDEVVGAAIFLASDASTYVNGQIIYVDGGMIAAM